MRRERNMVAKKRKSKATGKDNGGLKEGKGQYLFPLPGI